MFQSTNVRCISNLRLFDLLKFNECIDSTRVYDDELLPEHGRCGRFSKLAELRGFDFFPPSYHDFPNAEGQLVSHPLQKYAPWAKMCQIFEGRNGSENRSDLKPPTFLSFLFEVKLGHIPSPPIRFQPSYCRNWWVSGFFSRAPRTSQNIFSGGLPPAKG